MFMFYKQHLAHLEDSLKDARRKQHFKRILNLQQQIRECGADYRAYCAGRV